MLAQRDEGRLVKLAMPATAMISDLCFSDPAAMTNEERYNVGFMREIWKILADDFEKQRLDPLLFPDKVVFLLFI